VTGPAHFAPAARTLRDLAPLIAQYELDRAAEQALVLRRTDHDALARECGHGGRGAARLRDAELLAAGFRVVRFTWRQIAGGPEVVVARLAVLLAATRGRAA